MWSSVYALYVCQLSGLLASRPPPSLPMVLSLKLQALSVPMRKTPPSSILTTYSSAKGQHSETLHAYHPAWSGDVNNAFEDDAANLRLCTEARLSPMLLVQEASHSSSECWNSPRCSCGGCSATWVREKGSDLKTKRLQIRHQIEGSL
jgi:hypothetical protein